MQTVNFQCGHCGKLMGVGGEYLGRQVRCPHCQQVVIAPPPAAPTSPDADPPPATDEAAPSPQPSEIIAPAPPAADDAADIFAPPQASDDLFGRNELPHIEMPPDPSAPPPPPENAMPSLEAESTATRFSDGEASWPTGTQTETFAPPSAEPPVAPQPEPVAQAAPRQPRRREGGTPWLLILVVSPLLLYSIIITVFAALLYRQEQDLERQLRNRFEKMRDVGDNPGVQKGKKTTLLDNYNLKTATLPLPDYLCTTLKPSEPLVIGDLQVTPLRVQRKRVRLVIENFNPEPQPADSLVLYLALKNLSTEYAFAPLDDYFDRQWRRGQDQHPPLTQLEVIDNGYRFFGGPAQWYPRGDPNNLRERMENRLGVDPELLQPGEEKEFFVCTNGRDAEGVRILFGDNADEGTGFAYHGSFLWRIRVRRGLAWIGDKQISTTAVVGVRFTDKDVRGGAE